MITVCILGKDIKKTVETLFENDLSEVNQIITTADFPVKTEIPVEVIIFWLSENTELEDSTVEELTDIIEDFPDADIIYPNEILVIDSEEEVRTFNDWYGNERSLIQSLTLENYLPEWGVITKRSIFSKTGMFDENFEDYEFYDFLYKNLKNLKIKNSDLSFVTNRIKDSFI